MLAVSNSAPTPTVPKRKWLAPVRYTGQTILLSRADYIVSTHQHYVGVLSQQIQSFGQLPEGWDGYDAIAPSSQVISNAINVIASISSAWAMRLVKEDITPTPYGTITLEWQPGCAEYFGVEIGEESWAIFGQVEDNILSHTVRAAQYKFLLPAIDMALQKLYPEVNPQSSSFCAYFC